MNEDEILDKITDIINKIINLSIYAKVHIFNLAFLYTLVIYVYYQTMIGNRQLPIVTFTVFYLAYTVYATREIKKELEKNE